MAPSRKRKLRNSTVDSLAIINRISGGTDSSRRNTIHRASTATPPRILGSGEKDVSRNSRGNATGNTPRSEPPPKRRLRGRIINVPPDTIPEIRPDVPSSSDEDLPQNKTTLNRTEGQHHANHIQLNDAILSSRREPEGGMRERGADEATYDSEADLLPHNIRLMSDDSDFRDNEPSDYDTAQSDLPSTSTHRAPHSIGNTTLNVRRVTSRRSKSSADLMTALNFHFSDSEGEGEDDSASASSDSETTRARQLEADGLADVEVGEPLNNPQEQRFSAFHELAVVGPSTESNLGAYAADHSSRQPERKPSDQPPVHHLPGQRANRQESHATASLISPEVSRRPQPEPVTQVPPPQGRQSPIPDGSELEIQDLNAQVPDAKESSTGTSSPTASAAPGLELQEAEYQQADPTGPEDSGPGPGYEESEIPRFGSLESDSQERGSAALQSPGPNVPIQDAEGSGSPEPEDSQIEISESTSPLAASAESDALESESSDAEYQEGDFSEPDRRGRDSPSPVHQETNRQGVEVPEGDSCARNANESNSHKDEVRKLRSWLAEQIESSPQGVLWEKLRDTRRALRKVARHPMPECFTGADILITGMRQLYYEIVNDAKLPTLTQAKLLNLCYAIRTEARRVFVYAAEEVPDTGEGAMLLIQFEAHVVRRLITIVEFGYKSYVVCGHRAEWQFRAVLDLLSWCSKQICNYADTGYLQKTRATSRRLLPSLSRLIKCVENGEIARSPETSRSAAGRPPRPSQASMLHSQDGSTVFPEWSQVTQHNLPPSGCSWSLEEEDAVHEGVDRFSGNYEERSDLILSIITHFGDRLRRHTYQDIEAKMDEFC
ncbi:Uncharacterized protein PECH_007982 [Penicillium ucsense]|uniref:Uncharacterized protein n=1 Tax=Penicillium ucsense TaxID=2839758 RepID=A0A8J8W1X9_9EURO|nr:Uncharacterized protein PECM_006430 [Penicillium ucsense]KAF7734464.1 Uncharacterized protein PECH_007982 [Penicillium ucsense]